MVSWINIRKLAKLPIVIIFIKVSLVSNNKRINKIVVLERVIVKCVADANIAEVCAYGDKLIEEEVNLYLC